MTATAKENKVRNKSKIRFKEVLTGVVTKTTESSRASANLKEEQLRLQNKDDKFSDGSSSL